MKRHICGVVCCIIGSVVVACGSQRPTSAPRDAASDAPMESDAGQVFTPGSSSGGVDDGSASSSGGSGSGSSGGSDATVSPGSDASSSSNEAGSPGRAPGAVTCTAFGGACQFASDCCSGVCDVASNTCASSVTTCSPASAPCTTNTDCCTGACVAGACGAAQCLSIGAACPAAGNVCCTGNCAGGTCQPISAGASCTTAGNACSSNSACCSGLCDATQHCALASSYCIQTGDICYHADDCCGGLCTAPNGQPVGASNPGTCSQPSSGAVNCTGVDGSLCPGGSCGSCCSRLCAPYGPTGVNICQPAQGCRVEGDLCRTNADCCGATGSGVLGDGSVVCSNSMSGAAVGVCMTPGPTAEGGTCVPEGDVCHYNQSNYTCSISSARSDCCGPQEPKFLACVLDPFGVPRCNAYARPGDAGIGCVDAGGSCAMASDCCNGNPCVPDATGNLSCSPTACQSSGQSCTTNADCCAGLPCVAPPGSTHGTCSPMAPPPPPPPPSDDAGSDDASTGSDGAVVGSSSGGVSSSGGSSSGGSSSGGSSSGGGGADAGSACAFFGQSCTSLSCCPGTTCQAGKCYDVIQ